MWRILITINGVLASAQARPDHLVKAFSFHFNKVKPYIPRIGSVHLAAALHGTIWVGGKYLSRWRDEDQYL